MFCNHEEDRDVRARLGQVRLLRRRVLFLPVCSCSAERWKRAYEAFLEGKPLPPVELYKVGGAYFVVDGNHRVSVARYRGAMAVDTVVTEFA